jgi:uncharacterized protein YbjT (DUF2867 family)
MHKTRALRFRRACDIGGAFGVDRVEALAAALEQDTDQVDHHVGALRGRQRFNTIHTEGAANVARAAKAQGARLVHVSAIGADENSTSSYARSKAAAEHVIREIVPEATIMRPSIMFGPEDNFFNLFASLARMSPFLPLIGGGHTRFQPVFVGDVAQAIARAVDGEARAGTTYELGGPEVRTFREILEYILKTTERRRLLVPLPFLLAKLQASLMQFMPTPLLTPDQVELLRTDNVVSQEAMTQQRTLQGLGITTPEPIEAIVPSYLWRFRKTGQFRTQPTQ